MPRVDYELALPYRYVLDGAGQTHPRPSLPVQVIGPQTSHEVLAQVDSGSYYVVFDGEIAQNIGLDLPTGEGISLSTAAAGVPARLHEVMLDVEGHRFRCRAAFTEVPIPRCVLGREGFFSFWLVGFRHRLSEFYLSPDPDAPFLDRP